MRGTQEFGEPRRMECLSSGGAELSGTFYQRAEASLRGKASGCMTKESCPSIGN